MLKKLLLLFFILLTFHNFSTTTYAAQIKCQICSDGYQYSQRDQTCENGAGQPDPIYGPVYKTVTCNDTTQKCDPSRVSKTCLDKNAALENNCGNIPSYCLNNGNNVVSSCQKIGPDQCNGCKFQDNKGDYYCALMVDHGYRPFTANCPVCPGGYSPSADGKSCNSTSIGVGGGIDTQPAPSPVAMVCKGKQECHPGIGCLLPVDPTSTPDPNRYNPCPGGYDGKGGCPTVQSGLVSISTDPAGFAKTVLGLIMGLAGIIMLFIIIVTGYRLMFSQGDPEKVKEAREQLTGAVAGLFFIIFSIAILSFIGVNILGIPQFIK